MRTRVLLLLSLIVFGYIAGSNLAALFVVLGTHVILFVLHSIEVKINRLLDQHGIIVADGDIARD